MSHHFREIRGSQDLSSPQIRVRGANDFRHYTNERLRLPNERAPLGPRIKRLLGVLLTLAILAGIGIGVYFGVTVLLDNEDATVADPAETAATAEAASVAPTASAAAETQTAAQPAAQPESASPASQAATQPASQSTTQSAASSTAAAATDSQESAEAADEPPAAAAQAQQAGSAASTEQAVASVQLSVAVSEVEPTVAEQPVLSAQIGGAEISVESATAEPAPLGIPRSLADGADYDPTEPATVFTSRWPVGTTLRLTRISGGPQLSEEELAEIVGSQTLVVVRGTESSNADLQLSPAAFGQIAFEVERIINVSVEVTAPPP